MKFQNPSFIAAFIFVFSMPLFASDFIVSSDEDYLVSQDENYSFIYTKNESPIVNALMEHNRAFRKLYEGEFKWRFDDSPYLILASSRNQVTNGFATTYPTLHTVFYDGGAAAVDEFASTSWLFTLLSHETAHLYQTNVKHPYSSFLKTILGNAGPSLAVPFPYMILPNIFAPTFLLEGNALFNESRFGNGGRLYSGIYRAMFLNLLAAGKVIPERLINEHLYWPYTQEKYIVGGYLQLNLAQKHGIENVNNFFANNARHFINPFLLNKSFTETYGYGYAQAIQNLNLIYESLAKKMVPASGRVIARSQQHSGFTRHNQKVLFSTSDAISRPRLYQIKSNGGIESEKLNIPSGKVFVVNNRAYVPSAQTVSANEIRYGLFGEGMSPLPRFYNKYVYDMQDKKTAYADVPKSFVTTQLYVDGKFIDSVQSSALFTPQGGLVYFKQNGEIRELISNDLNGAISKITEFRGYYGKPVDVTSAGEVYFTGATASGSSLFRVSPGKPIERVLTADTVADAKFFDADKLVVAAITDNGYEYLQTSLSAPHVEQPEHYKYFFESQEMQKFYQPLAESKPVPSVPYSSTGAMKFDAIDPLALGFTNTDFVAGAQISFSDPLQQQKIAFLYLHDVGDTNNAVLGYSNSVYLLNFDFGAAFEQSAVFTDDTQERVQARFDTWSATLGAQYPLYARGQIDTEMRTRYTYTYEDTIPVYDSYIEKDHSLLTELEWSRALGYGRAYDYNSFQSILLGHEVLHNVDDFEKQTTRYVGEVKLIEDLSWENFISASYKSILSDAKVGDIKISDSALSSSLLKSTEMSRYTPDTLRRYVQVNKVSAGYQKAINFGYYFTSFPLSVRRFAPFAKYQEFYGARSRGDEVKTLFHEWSYGVEIEFLLLHKIPLRLAASKAEMNKRKDSTYSTMLTAAHEF